MQKFEAFLRKVMDIQSTNRFLSFEGYLEEEIVNYFGEGMTHLPQTYLMFLRLMGRKAFFLDGQTYSIDKLAQIRHTAEGLVSRNNPRLNVEENHFVFLTNQGCIFVFFNIKEGNNPPVYGFAEAANQQKFEKITNSLTEFFERMLYDDISLYNPMVKYSTFSHDVYRLKEEAKSQKKLYIPFDIFSKVKESFKEQEVEEVIDVLETLYQEDHDLELMISCARAILFLASGNIEAVKDLCLPNLKNEPSQIIAHAEQLAGNPGHGFSIPFDQIASLSENFSDKEKKQNTTNPKV